MTIAAALEAAIKAVCPILGVSIGRVADKATWRIDFDPTATAEQRAAAAEAFASFDTAASTPAIVTYEQLRARLSAGEREAVLSSNDWRVRDFTLWASANNSIDLRGRNASAAKALLVSLGLLTQQRADAVFAP